MNMRKDNHRHVWLLSGTGDGPKLAKLLKKEGWKVSVSVVSDNAASKYLDLSLEALWVGPLNGVIGIKEVLMNAHILHKGFDWVIDATHPFAVVISSDLKKACLDLFQPLIRYERYIPTPTWAKLLTDLRELPREDLRGKNVLLAIGSRNLKEAVSFFGKSGSNVFARVFPSPESMHKALGCLLPEDQIAIVRPSLIDLELGLIESAICIRWSIDFVICRQSGGVTQSVWQEVCKKQNIKLFLLKRPESLHGVQSVKNFSELLKEIAIRS